APDGRAARALAGRLAGSFSGDVRADGATRAIYSTDSSNYRHVPVAVVAPRDEADVCTALEACREFGLAVLARGAGTSLAGQACNEAVVLDTSRYMDEILEVDLERRVARVQPGVVLDDLRAATAGTGVTFGPDPATHAWCTLGGMIGNNSCGTHALVAGKTVDNVERLRVVSYAGDVMDLGSYDAPSYEAALRAGGATARVLRQLRELVDGNLELVRGGYPSVTRRVSGYNLDELLPERGFHVARSLVGTESTCVVLTEATVSLVEMPVHHCLVVLGFEDVYRAADHVPELLRHDLLGLEGFDDTLVSEMRSARLNLDDLELLPEGGGWLLAEVGGASPDEALARARALASACPAGAVARVVDQEEEQRALWRVRESGLGATARPPGKPPNHEGWEDAAVSPERLGEYLRGIRALWDEHGYSGAWYGHFGQGCVHTRNDFDLRSERGIASFRSYIERAADLCISLGGSISGEHGDGQARGELLEKMYGPELVDAFRSYKAVFDPTGMMNPGRVVDARPLDSDLRHGPDEPASALRARHFAFAADAGSMRTAVDRCVGVGRCRRDDTGVMCPSFRVTRDEEHSTRGRAKLLSEMFRGEVTPATWRNDEVREALDLCLSCKGCLTDCPVHVDMAAYKAEFLAHYYKGRVRPRSHYALGLLPWWSRLASRVPALANTALGEHAVGAAAKRLAGITTRRAAPRYASPTFRRSPEARGARDATGATVVLWPDTFSDLYRPERAAAALRLLESAGEVVAVPGDWACCGRPLYDAGMLGRARRALLDVLDVLEPWTSAGVPVVVPEPSCLATFRDELVALLPDDPRAASLAGLARSVAEHLDAAAWRPDTPLAGERAVVHPHCHGRAVAGTGAERRVLERAGYRVEVLDAGCCGLAGSFGFRSEHDALSRQIAEDRFLPALRSLEPGTVLVLDGFSCATQARDLGAPAGRSLAEVLLDVAAGPAVAGPTSTDGDGPGASPARATDRRTAT
nr:FAD-binding and (Fe-S)-binding domain-containing protein [Actinomycetota bacterium]